MVKMTVETTQMNQKLVVLLHVVQDSFNVTTLIVFFQCIFVTEMMIVGINQTKRTAWNIHATGNSSNV